MKEMDSSVNHSTIQKAARRPIGAVAACQRQVGQGSIAGSRDNHSNSDSDVSEDNIQIYPL